MRLRYKAVMLLMGALMAVTLAGLACGGSDEPSTDTPAPEPTETLPTGNTVHPTITTVPDTPAPDQVISTTSPEVTQTPSPTLAEEQPAATATPGAQSETTPQPTPEEARSTSTPQPTPTIAEAQPTSTPTPAPTPLASLGLFLQVTGVDSESVVRNNTVTISGVTSPDAVLSINGILVPINEEGEFEVTLSLDSGANLIEVIASDFEGNEESAVLAIVSIPEEA